MGARVLVVDDSAVVRKVVSELLAKELGGERIVTAATGRIALAKLAHERPDVVILDVDMPEMDGLETLKAMREQRPDVAVVMFSVLTERAGALTLDALALGARDYVTKPSNVGDVRVPFERVRDELVAKVRALLAGAARPRPPRTSPPAPAPAASVAPASRATSRPVAAVELVAIGASTGGPNALAQVFEQLPPDLDVPVLVVQHMPPLFTKLFAERLDRQSGLRVREAHGGEALVRGEAWVARGDYHLAVTRDGEALRLEVSQGPPENSCRPAVDVLFRSAADAVGAGVLGVVLTGMGQDGLAGSERVRARGGRVVVQDEASSVVWSMPGSIAGAGLADEIVPLGDVAAAITRRVRAGARA